MTGSLPSLKFAMVVNSLVLVLALVSSSPAKDGIVVLADFDGVEKLSTSWTALGEISVSRDDVPEGVEHDGVEGKCLTAKAGKSSKLAVKATFPRPDYESASAIRLRAKAEEASADAPLVIEFQVFSAERRAWLWRKVTLDRAGWQTIDLPLRHFRHSPGAFLDWKEAHRFAIHFRNAGTLSIDKIELVTSDAQRPAYLSAEELGDFAFGDEAKYASKEPFVIVSDEPRLDADAVLAACSRLYERITRDFPDLPGPRRPVVLLIFADEKEYQGFWRKLGERFNSVVPIVSSGGYAIFGVAGSSYSDKFGAVRPVYVQEACHALLAQMLGVSNQSEWLHEGLANYYQLQWSKQDIHALTRGMIEGGTQIPLAELMDGSSIGQRNYGQAVLFTKWLLEDEKRRSQLQSAIAEMKSSTSTKLAPLAEKHFSMSIEEMEAAWLKWARATSE